MQPQTDGDYKKLLTDVIKKQIIVLGPDITLAKARNVPGLSIADDGTVLEITGNPQELTQKLIEEFMELSGLIVKKTMEPLLASYPGLAASSIQPEISHATPQVQAPIKSQPAPTPQPLPSVPPVQVSTQPPSVASQPTLQQPISQPSIAKPPQISNNNSS